MVGEQRTAGRRARDAAAEEARSPGDGRAAAEDAAELREWLARTPPQVPPKHFYDVRGSELFEAITRTPEYYPTRTETAILERHADELVAALGPVELAEIGSGASVKTRILLSAMEQDGRGRRCTVFDIAADFLERSAAELRARHPGLEVRTVVGDFHTDLHLLGPGGRRLLVFLAGTIGNLDPQEAADFLAQVAAIMAPDDAFLLGVDLVKDARVLEAAYDDAGGVTAAFDLNLLRVLNARFGADFDPADFRHRATWNAEERRVEMWLDAQRDVDVSIPGAGTELHLRAGEGIRTELSCKYTRALLEERLGAAGLALERWLTDEGENFALALIRRQRGAEA